MKREIKITVDIPKDILEDFRLFTVLHGGKIIEQTEIKEEKINYTKNLLNNTDAV